MSFGHSVHQLPFQGGCVGQLLRRSLGLKRFLVKQMHSPWHWLFHTRTARQSARLTYAQYKTRWRLTGSGGRKICLYVWGRMQTARHVTGMCFSRCLALKRRCKRMEQIWRRRRSDRENWRSACILRFRLKKKWKFRLWNRDILVQGAGLDQMLDGKKKIATVLFQPRKTHHNSTERSNITPYHIANKKFYPPLTGWKDRHSTAWYPFLVLLLVPYLQ